MRSDFSTIGWRLWPLAFLLASAQADTLEEKVARGFVRDFERNEARLREIETELASLPTPYMREPTGTGGYLSHGRGSCR